MCSATRFKPPGYRPYTFGPQKAIAQIRLEYADGSVETVGTDESWRVAPGPITFGFDLQRRRFRRAAGAKRLEQNQFQRFKMAVRNRRQRTGRRIAGTFLRRAADPFLKFTSRFLSRTIANGDMRF
jgi:hypothetical protein